MWFDIASASMGFIGSVIFSAGLIKNKQQILDENSTYLDNNPFTLKAELRSQPYFIVGIGLIIIGFAASISGKIGDRLEHNQLLLSLLIMVSISFFGFFAMAVFYIVQSKVHQKNKIEHRKKIFYHSLRKYSGIMHGINGKDNDAELFVASKETFQKDLLEKAKSIPEPDNENELSIVSDIGSTSSAYQFYVVTKSYFE